MRSPSQRPAHRVKGITRLIMVYVNHIRLNNTPERGKEIGRQHAAEGPRGRPVGRRHRHERRTQHRQHHTASGAVLNNAAMMPVSTSPIPPLAIPALPASIMPIAPLSLAYHRARAFQHNHAAIPFYQTLRRKQAIAFNFCHADVFSRRAASPGCGVSTRL